MNDNPMTDETTRIIVEHIPNNIAENTTLGGREAVRAS